MEKLKQRLQTALKLDDESIDQLASYVTFQGTSQAMVESLTEILGDRDQAQLLIDEYFNSHEKATAKPQADDESAKSSSKSGTATPIGVHELNAQEVEYMNLLTGSNWTSGGSSTPQKKDKKSTNQNNQNKKGESSSKVKIDSLSDIEAALRQVELGASRSSFKRVECNCMGSRHPLVEAAPNCLNCGRIVCMKEGLGPCFFCGEPLISEDGMRKIIAILNAEKTDISSTMGRKAKAAAVERGISLSNAKDRSKTEAEIRLNKLLDFQDTSAQRTRIVDEVSDFDTTNATLNMWASPEEQVKQLKKQQKQLRKLEEQKKARSGRGKKVISIDLHGNKVVLRERTPVEGDSDYEISDSEDETDTKTGGSRIKTGVDNKEIKPENKKAAAFWEAKSYGKDFIHPIYVHDESEPPQHPPQKGDKNREKNPKQKSKIMPVDQLTGQSRLEYDEDEDEAVLIELLA